MDFKNWFGGIDLSRYQPANFDLSITELGVPEYLHIKLASNHSDNLDHGLTLGGKIAQHQFLTSIDPASPCMHAPTAGTVISLPEHENNQLIIKTQTSTNLTTEITTDYQSLSPAEIIENLNDSGVVGLGGAGFPTAQKLSQPVDTLIINAAECEPYVYCDQALILASSKEILLGAKILAKACMAKDIVIAIEADKVSALDSLKHALLEIRDKQIKICPLPTLYPSGAEPQLIKFLTGLEVPHGKHPYNIGIGCYNVATAYASYQAIALQWPLTSRVVSLCGNNLKHPGNYRCLIGTPISTLLHAAGHQPSTAEQVIVGGPMMGKLINNLKLGIEKTTYCIIVTSQAELLAKPQTRACIRCGECAQVCPAQLLPQQLYSHIKNHDYQQAQNFGLFDCIECGACAYVCPSKISLVSYYQQAKAEVKTQKLVQTKAAHAQARFEARQARLSLEKSQRLDKRESLRLKLKQDALARKSLLTSALAQASKNKY